MKRFFQWFRIQQRSIHQAAVFLAFFSTASVFLGLLRDRLLASRFGASQELDIYYGAFRVPDLLYTLSLFLTATTAFIPIFLRERAKDPHEGPRIIGSVSSSVFLSLLIVGAAAWIAMPSLLQAFLPGFSAETLARTIVLSRIMLLSPLLLGLSNIVASVLQSFKIFFVYALSPVFYNLGIILGILFLVPRFGLAGLALGVVGGAFLHLAIQLPALWNLGLAPRNLLKPFTRLVFSVVKLSFPRALGLSINQLMLIVLTGIGSTLSAGSIAVFNFASNLQSFPTNLIGVSYSIAAFPYLASLYIHGDKERFFKQAEDALRQIIFWTLAATGLVLVLRAHIVRVVLGAGAFSWADTRLTTAALGILSLAILSQSLVLLFSRAFYARGETAKPVAVNIVSSIATVAVSLYAVSMLSSRGGFRLFFGTLFRVEDVADISVLGLALGVFVGSVFNAAVLFMLFYKVDGVSYAKVFESFSHALSGALIAGGVAYGVLKLLALFFAPQTFVGIFIHGGTAGILGVVAASLFWYATRNKEFFEFLSALRTRFWESSVIAPEQEKL